MLEVEDLHTYYGTSHILQGISLRVDEGRFVCLLGRNGAGKTTTLKSIMGIVHPARGSIKYREQSIMGKASDKIAQLGIGYVPEDRRIYPAFSVMENLEIGQQGGRKGEWDTDKVLQLFPKLKELTKRRGEQLSGGEQQMLTIARTLMANPEFLLLDEPSEGLAPIIVSALATAMGELKKHGISTLLSEQNARFAVKVADWVYVIDGGRIIFEGTVDDLLSSKDRLRRYLAL